MAGGLGTAVRFAASRSRYRAALLALDVDADADADVPPGWPASSTSPRE